MEKFPTLLIVLLMAIALMMPMGALPAGADDDDPSLKRWGFLITEVSVGFGPPDTITIRGRGFGFDQNNLRVTLGDFGPLDILSVEPNTIVAACPLWDPSSPPDPATNPRYCSDGDFLLTVSNRTARWMNDQYDLTIGAAGPQGPAGPPGEQGLPGPQGLPGISGFEFVLVSFGRVVGVNDRMIVHVTCPVGKTALSGAFILTPSGTSDVADYNQFLFSASQQNGSNQWIFEWENADDVSHDFRGVARAACAFVQ